MNDKFLKPYNPQDTEPRIYKIWEESGFFNPDNLPERHKVPFTVMMPPPNVTGILHMGHGLGQTIQDILIRYKRMRGFKTLWLPGTDHAAIATQAKVEKEIYKKEGKSRHDLGKEEFLKRVNAFAKESHDTMIEQLKTLGTSCDWSREAFTLDEKRGKAVNEIFKRMYDDGLIYQGTRVINWDPKGQTTISDDEIVYEERDSKLYTFKYSSDFPIPIATTRPETKIGDTAVAVHPSDERYQKYIGKTYMINDFCGTRLEIKIVADESVDPTFGTGALGVTPAHSQIDEEIAKRHNLPSIQVIDEYAKICADIDNLRGEKVLTAREKIVTWIKENNLLIEEKDIKQNIATSDRTGGVIEPLPKKQWFVDVNKPIKNRGNKSLKELMLEPIINKEIKIIPDNFEKIYLHWANNLRDWCISRQIWYGHKIPIEGETDTLDTWFSSGLWTFSTLGWPDDTEDLKTYHPTDVIVSGYEILFFWIARMILMSKYALGENPFHTIYLTGIVRDDKGRKFSKSLGNGMDPREVSAKYGIDAGRMALIIGNTPATDSRISETKVKGYKNFANKIWNITRFVLSQNNNKKVDEKLKEEFDTLAKDVTEDMENYRFYIVAEKIYAYIWHRFADEILEESKKKPELTGTLYYILENSLKLLHPFMPFVTEEIWSSFKNKDGQENDKLLMIEAWPVK